MTMNPGKTLRMVHGAQRFSIGIGSKTLQVIRQVASGEGKFRASAHQPIARRWLPTLAVAACWSVPALAQSQPALSNTELSKEAVNPVTLYITLPLRYEADFNDGPYKATKSTYKLDQAVLPFRLNEDWALITHTKLPGYTDPSKNKGEPWTS